MTQTIVFILIASFQARHDDPVIRRALMVLGRSVGPIMVLDALKIRDVYSRIPGAGVPPDGLNAFRISGDPNIYVNRESLVYQSAARKPSAFTVVRLAATLLHERVHDTEGESGAYRAQSDFVGSRLNGVPWREQELIRQYWRGLDDKARALAHAEKRSEPIWR